MLNIRLRYIFSLSAATIFLVLALFYHFGVERDGNAFHLSSTAAFAGIAADSKPMSPPPRIYKPTPTLESRPIVDNFPFADLVHSPDDFPPIPSWNQPPATHVPEKTPLLIGFTRNWRLLQQVVVSYITAGWPPSDIYVVENTGVMHSNKNNLLTLQNPFFLNHTRLHLLGVNILITPTLFTFAQLQNYYLYTSIENNWTHYFWSHMDVVAVSFEDHYAESHHNILPPNDPNHDYSDFSSIYENCISSLRKITSMNPETGKVDPWAMHFFSYDRLALVNVQAFLDVGAWDTMIPFYMTDCDMHARLEMMNHTIKETWPGMVIDVSSSLDDLFVLYRKKGGPEASWKNPELVEEELGTTANTEAKLGEHEGESSGDISSQDNRDEKAKDPWLISAKDIVDGKGKWEEDTIWSESFQHMIRTLDDMTHSKGSNAKGRNTWQVRQRGGFGEPFYRDPDGFELAILMTIQHGKNVFADKWGHRDCDIVAMGLKPTDAWKVEHDW